MTLKNNDLDIDFSAALRAGEVYYRPLPEAGVAPVEFTRIGHIESPPEQDFWAPIPHSQPVDEIPAWVDFVGLAMIAVTAVLLSVVVLIQVFRLAEWLVF